MAAALTARRSGKERPACVGVLPAVTTDGHEVSLWANIGHPAEAKTARELGGAEGVGLFRTEFLYMGRDRLPSEEEQLAVYRQAVEHMGSLSGNYPDVGYWWR